MNLDLLAKVAGLWVVLAFTHFIADFIFQGHDTAMAKSHDWRVRAKHCVVYTVFFLPVLFVVFGLSSWKYTAALVLLFGSHFLIDTYWPVLIWAKYLRMFPEFKEAKASGIITVSGVQLGTVEGDGKVVVQPGFVMRTNDGREMEVIRTISATELEVATTDATALRRVFATSIGALLCIVVDQLCHLTVLWGVAALVLW